MTVEIFKLAAFFHQILGRRLELAALDIAAFFHRPGLFAGLDEPFIQHPTLHPQRRVFDFLRIQPVPSVPR